MLCVVLSKKLGKQHVELAHISRGAARADFEVCAGHDELADNIAKEARGLEARLVLREAKSVHVEAGALAREDEGHGSAAAVREAGELQMADDQLQQVGAHAQLALPLEDALCGEAVVPARGPPLGEENAEVGLVDVLRNLELVAGQPEEVVGGDANTELSGSRSGA